jgi:DNA-binding response OmpR family regulator
MLIAILEDDEVASHVLSAAARRAGHQALTLPPGDGLPAQLPMAPSALLVAVEAVTPESLQRVVRMQERWPETQVIVASETISDLAALDALEAGIEVVRKPYHPREVLLRAERNHGGGNGRGAEPEVQSIGDLTVDLAAYTATKNGAVMELTKLELRLLYSLMVHHGGVATTERLLSFGWEDAEWTNPSLLKTHITHLRAKLREPGGDAFEIRSRHSMGYALLQVA